MESQIADAGKLLRPRDLTMHDAVAVIRTRMLRKGFLQRVKDLVQAGIADRMDSDLHAVRVGIADHFFHLLSAEQRKAGSRGIICIGA